MIRYRVLALALAGGRTPCRMRNLEDEDGRPRPSEALHQQGGAPRRLLRNRRGLGESPSVGRPSHQSEGSRLAGRATGRESRPAVLPRRRTHPGSNQTPLSTSKSCLKTPICWPSTYPAGCLPSPAAASWKTPPALGTKANRQRKPCPPVGPSHYRHRLLRQNTAAGF